MNNLIDRVLVRPGLLARECVSKNPWSNVYGLSRSLLATGTACTLMFNSVNVLFTPTVGLPMGPLCDKHFWGSGASLFCMASVDQLEPARWLSVLILLIVTSGWRPQLTAIPHAWVAYSFFSSVPVREGGDQITFVLTVLLLPVALLDSRRWHWLPPSHTVQPNSFSRLLTRSSFLMIRLQVALVYFVAGLAKVGQTEWANGTATYYWAHYLGAPRWAADLLTNPILVVASTWGTIVVEVSLGIGLFLPKKSWRYFLAVGVVFHLLIALAFGLWSFSMAMTAALILYFRPADEPFSLLRPVFIIKVLQTFKMIKQPSFAPHRDQEFTEPSK